ncbi:HupE/UreJ family protein [Acinetobacter tandoii]|nr:HupE/UreJ family protein [Acinetobacter tandoii]
MIKNFIRVFILFWITCLAQVWAHEIRPAYLQINQTDPEHYNVLWKVPSRGETVIDIQPEFDPAFHLKPTRNETVLNGFVIFHYQLTGNLPLQGTALKIKNLPLTTIDVLVNIHLQDGQKYSFLIQPSTDETIIPQNPTKWNVVKTYTILGIEHILLGFDHLLFVLALIILTKGAMRIVKTITAFTLAHSITLGMASLGYVYVPGPPVEAVIALSIMFLALEILRGLNGQATLTATKPWLVAFTFGLLHGFGFAGALSEIGLPQNEIPLALAFFNVGVELGQLAFVGVMLLVIYLLHLKKDWPLWLQKVPPYAIGTISAFWVIERVSGFMV